MSTAAPVCALLAACALAVALGPGPASARLNGLRLAAGPDRRGTSRAAGHGSGMQASMAGCSRRLRAVMTRRKAAVRRRTAVVEVARALAAELRAGRTPHDALDLAVQASARDLGESSADLLLDVARAGADPESVAGALDVVGREAALSGCRHLAACWRIGSGAGAGFAVGVDHVAAALRADARAREDVQAQMAAPRSTARLLAGLPAFGLLLGAMMGASPQAFLFGTVAGWACLVVATGLELAGLVWTRRLVNGATADAASGGR